MVGRKYNKSSFTLNRRHTDFQFLCALVQVVPPIGKIGIYYRKRQQTLTISTNLAMQPAIGYLHILIEQSLERGNHCRTYTH